jgi:hypothetical protein
VGSQPSTCSSAGVRPPPGTAPAISWPSTARPASGP